jgi:hypothetical protein
MWLAVAQRRKSSISEIVRNKFDTEARRYGWIK